MTSITITTDYMQRNKAMAVPGAYFDFVSKSYLIERDEIVPRTALILLKLFPELAITEPSLEATRDAFVQDVRPLNFADEWWATQDQDQPTAAPLVEAALAADGKYLHPFQRADLNYLLARLQSDDAAYLGWERGLGKTMGAIWLAEATGAEKIMILSSNTAKTAVWDPEWAAWASARGLPVSVMPNEKSKREAFVEGLVAKDKAGEPTGVVFAHYEALQIIGKMRARNRGWDRIGEWDLMVADEAHHLSTKKSLRTRALKRIPTKMKLALSGSIISNHAGELYSQLNWLFPKRYSNELRDWNDRFLDWVDLEGHREYIGARLDRLEEMRRELGLFMTYRRKGDELDLPPITIQDLPVQLSGSQRRIYDDLARDAITQLESGAVLTAANGLALLTLLRRVATGALPHEDDLSDSSKIDTAVDLIRDNPDEAFLVFSYFVAPAEALARRLENLGIPTFTVHGGVADAQRTQFISRFQAGEGRVFVGTLGTLGESVTLSRASNVVFLDRSWNPQLNDQSVDRVAGGFRALQVGRPITVTNLVAIDTVDETKLTPVLNSKAAVRAVVLGRGRN